MQKLKMHSPDMTQDNIAKIREMFPNCVTEAHGEGGEVASRVDFDLLRQELSSVLVEGGQERYRLDWPGKRQALLTANAPIAKTLRPCREESVDFDTTKNLYIEGDNLDALKLLQESYLGKVKMIYIDPPYNTGNDFIYEDDFAEDAEEYLKKSNQKDEDGNRLVLNSDANGRFHSDWLAMMYSRLKLARNLLKDDGIIFISMDDSELTNLKFLCDEIFGNTNYYCTFVWKRRSGSMDAVNNVSSDHEYVLCYGKVAGKLNGVLRTFERYSNPDNDPRGPWIADNLSAGKPGGDTYYPIKDPDTGHEFWPPRGRYWPYSPSTMSKKIQEGRVIFPKNNNGAPLLKRFQYEAKSNVLPISTWCSDAKSAASNALIVSLNTEGTKEIKELFADKIFNFPKPTALIMSLLRQGSDNDSIVLDFFSGSATTAHAVMQLNAEDGGKRQFIMVQLPEICDEKSEASKAGYATIAEIGKERIRRAGKKILESDYNAGWNKDVGFRVLKVDSSCMKDVYYTPDQISQKQLSLFADNIKPDRRDKPDDLLYQILIDWGVELHLPVNSENIQGKKVFFVDENALAACFDISLDEQFMQALVRRKPMRIVLRDAGFSSDSSRINFEQIIKQISPGTELKVL